MPENEARSLSARWAELRQQQPSLRIRDAAQQLGVSELDLVALGSGETCRRLQPEWRDLLAQLSHLGEVMALTRSDSCVHEVYGRFGEPHYHGDTALFFRPGMDTRYFLSQWTYAYAVDENNRLSLQFFSHDGTAIHKIYLTANSHKAAYEQLVQQFQHPQPMSELILQPHAEPQPALVWNAEKTKALRAAWAGMQDVHEGNRIIRDYEQNRLAVYQALGEEFARSLALNSIERLLEQLAAQQHPFILFGMNTAAVQSFSGTITRLVTMGPWFNILDEGFNLHLKIADIHSVWHLKKPSSDGLVHSLEVLDTKGQAILVMTDQRQRGQAESLIWQELLQGLGSLTI